MRCSLTNALGCDSRVWPVPRSLALVFLRARAALTLIAPETPKFALEAAHQILLSSTPLRMIIG